MLLFGLVQGLYTLLGAGFWGSFWSDFGLILAIWGLPLCVPGMLPPSSTAGTELLVSLGSPVHLE